MEAGGRGEALIREAREGDIPLILELIRALADYEHLLDRVEATEEGLRRCLFQEHFAEALIAEWEGAPAGFALFFHTFSTFVGKPGIYIEDIFVKPEFRGRGLGKALFVRIGGIAAERGCGRLEWACLNWNEPAIRFYRSRGGAALDEWTTFRMSGEGLARLGEGHG
ncbi:MAG: GNAT family N-acetyltransferase [Spirochaetaceae bacterium]|jgi:GNAT superfamily N-acetyltransferase|nr:GNAT family N-acetyltransferase [Spirochaetaceae bacterium]